MHPLQYSQVVSPSLVKPPLVNPQVHVARAQPSGRLTDCPQHHLRPLFPFAHRWPPQMQTELEYGPDKNRVNPAVAWRAGIQGSSRATAMRRPTAEAMAADALTLVKKWAADRWVLAGCLAARPEHGCFIASQAPACSAE